MPRLITVAVIPVVVRVAGLCCGVFMRCRRVVETERAINRTLRRDHACRQQDNDAQHGSDADG
jgi:hypothetical protein